MAQQTFKDDLLRGADGKDAARGAALSEQLSQRPAERVLEQAQKNVP